MLRAQAAILGDDGRVRVMDFGLARAPLPAREEETLPEPEDMTTSVLTAPMTVAGALVGTPRYMAPEQFRGGGDAKSDQFALCVALYEALFGLYPFEGDSFATLVLAVADGRVRTPAAGSTSAAAVPSWARRAIVRGLAADPDERWPSVAALIQTLDRDPALRRRRALLAACGLLGAAGIGLVGVSHLRAQARVCDAASKLQDDWSPQRGEAIGAALRASGRAYADAVATRVVETLDRYAQDWIAASEEACAATRLRGEQSPALMDARLVCLERRRRAMTALVDVLSETGVEDADSRDRERVSRAAQAALSLPSIERCADLDYVTARVPPPEDELRERLAADIEGQLARVEALFGAGQYRAARALAEEQLRAAESLGYAPLIAESRFHVGKLLGATGESERAVELLERAYFEAESSGLDERAGWTALVLVGEYSARLERIELSLDWAEHARAKAARLEDPALRAGVFNNVGMAHSAAGDYPRALESFEAALALTEEHGLSSSNRRTAQDNIGHALRQLGRHAEAIEYHRLAIAEVERALGREHPDAATTWNNLGVTYRESGSYDEAERAFARSLEIRRAAYDPGHPRIASTLMNLGNLEASRCELERALELYDEVASVMEAAYGPEHPTLAGVSNNIGSVLLSLNRPRDALPYFERACAGWERALGEDHRHADICAYNQARALLGTGRADEALPLAERALALRSRGESPNKGSVAMALARVAEIELARARLERAGERALRAIELSRDATLEPGDLAIVQFVAARALWAQGREPARARALAERARDALREHASCGPLPAAVDAALKAAP